MSEFGTGFAYCLGLFLCHDERIREYSESSKSVPQVDFGSMWFNGAADHLYGLVIPESLPKKKRQEIAAWRDKCLAFRLCMKGEKCTFEDCRAAIQYAKDLLRYWDNRNGIKTEKGDWE